MGEMIYESIFRWFGHIEIVGKDKNAKRVYVGECIGSRSFDRRRGRLINSVNDFLKKKKEV